MTRLLVLTIHLHDRYHGMAQGAPEWPPSPARAFQALVAGMARGNGLDAEALAALAWLEGLPPPAIAAPAARLGQEVGLYVPNNDADTLTDPTDVSKLRTLKLVHPRLVERGTPLHYAWPIGMQPDADQHTPTLLAGADRIYQLGRGVDQAWARAAILDPSAWDNLLAGCRGTLLRPTNGGGKKLACPVPGSLQSLELRHHWRRLEQEGKVTLLRNAPKPRFVLADYAPTAARLHFELRDRHDPDTVRAWPVTQIVRLVERVRDCAAARLRTALPSASAAIDATLVGNRPGATAPQPLTARARIVPIPSIGHEHADLGVRRVTIETPHSNLLPQGDLAWALNGLDLSDPSDQSTDLLLVAADDTAMHGRYATQARRWRSLTPIALPDSAARRRIEPARAQADGKPAAERQAEEAQARRALATALRQAGVVAAMREVHVQREPFQRRGSRAEQFAEGTRFAKERLWHAEIVLAAPVSGPLVLGDGRFLGLGLMQPIDESDGMFSFHVEAEVPEQATDLLVNAMRRAVLARAQDAYGREPLPTFFTGHAEDGSPARSDEANHVAVHWDGPRQRLLVLAPHRLDRRPARAEESRELACLNAGLADMRELIAGRSGRHDLTPTTPAPDDPCLAPARVWESVEPYAVTRHAQHGTAPEAIIADCLVECARRSIPKPNVTVVSWQAVPARGLRAHLRLEFDTAVSGPIVLGKTRYRGGGLFAAHP